MPYCIICGNKVANTGKHLQRNHKKVWGVSLANGISNSLFYIEERISKLIVDSIGVPKVVNLKNILDFRVQLKKKRIKESEPVVEEEYQFAVNDIHFNDRTILISDIKKVKNFTIGCTKSFTALNLIKSDLYRKIFKNKLCKLIAIENAVIIEKSPDVDTLLKSVEEAIGIYNNKNGSQKRFKSTKSRTSEAKDLKKPHYISDNSFLGYDPKKEKFFTYLHQASDKSEKIYVVKEHIGAKVEQGLLFIIKKMDGNKIVIWENVFCGRATKVFNYVSPELLRSLMQFINAETGTKREIFINQKIDNSEYNIIKRMYHFLASEKHTSLDEFKSAISNLRMA